jgi:hypothetical protein
LALTATTLLIILIRMWLPYSPLAEALVGLDVLKHLFLFYDRRRYEFSLSD